MPPVFTYSILWELTDLSAEKQCGRNEPYVGQIEKLRLRFVTAGFCLKHVKRLVVRLGLIVTRCLLLTFVTVITARSYFWEMLVFCGGL